MKRITVSLIRHQPHRGDAYLASDEDETEAPAVLPTSLRVNIEEIKSYCVRRADASGTVPPGSRINWRCGGGVVVEESVEVLDRLIDAVS